MAERVAAGLFPEGLAPATPLRAAFGEMETLPTPTFMEAIEDISAEGTIPRVQEWAEITYERATDAKNFGHLRDSPMSVEGVAAVMQYTAEDSKPPLYKDMNSRCYNRDRRQILPYVKFLWLLVKSLEVLEPFVGTVYRGVKLDLSQEYIKGRKFTWHGPCSCTKRIEVLKSDLFCGTSGKRTIFAVELTQLQAREISRYSIMGSEEEVLLPPGCRFEVVGVLPQGDLTIVQVVEQPSKEWIIDIRPAGLASSAVTQAAPSSPTSAGSAQSVPSAAAAVSSSPAVRSYTTVPSVPTPVAASQEPAAAARVRRGQGFTIKNKSTGFVLTHFIWKGLKCEPTPENHIWFLNQQRGGARFGGLSGRLYNVETKCWLEHVDGSTGRAGTLGWFPTHESMAGDHWWYYWKLEWVDQDCVKIIQYDNGAHTSQRWALALGFDNEVCVVRVQQDAPLPSQALWEVQ